MLSESPALDTGIAGFGVASKSVSSRVSYGDDHKRQSRKPSDSVPSASAASAHALHISVNSGDDLAALQPPITDATTATQRRRADQDVHLKDRDFMEVAKDL